MSDNQKAIDLINKWLTDESGYDEKVWPIIASHLQEQGKITIQLERGHGKKLAAIRQKAIDGGMPLLSAKELEQEIHARRCDNCADLQKRLEEAHALISDAMTCDRPQEWLDRANAWFPKV